MLKGLVIQKEHLDNILNGLKTVEIRKQNTKKREKIALCNKGHIYGFAEVVNSYPVSRKDLLSLEWEKKHRATKFLQSGSYSKENELWVWELSQIQKLDIPIPYVHPQGAIIWVNLKVEDE